MEEEIIEPGLIYKLQETLLAGRVSAMPNKSHQRSKRAHVPTSRTPFGPYKLIF